MRLHVTPGRRIEGEATPPGDKSIAHRWLLLAATAAGTSRLGGIPRSLDTLSTVSCLTAVAPSVRPALEAWLSRPSGRGEANGSTWNPRTSTLDLEVLELEGEGRGSLREPAAPLDCGNSGTTMRLLCGILAGVPVPAELVGDPSLSLRPMERVARPLRQMGAEVVTEDGHAPVRVRGGDLGGIRFDPDVPSAQVKGAVLLAALAARGTTTLREAVATRDHTERVLGALGAPIRSARSAIELEGPFQHEGLEGTVPGDASSAAFLIAAAAVTGGGLTVRGVGLNPSRLRFLEVMRRMGVPVEARVEAVQLGEPLGRIDVLPASELGPARIDAGELPLVIDEVPVLAIVAAHGSSASVFEGAGELRVKESDRLAAIVEGLRGLGGHAATDGDRLTVRGGGLTGGAVSAGPDHRIAMALVVASLAAHEPSQIEGIGSAEVSYPGFVGDLRALGASVEVAP